MNQSYLWNMKDHFQYTDDQFEAIFARAELDPALFDHEAHIRLAWIHIKQYGVDNAIDNIRKQLRAFVSKVGAEDKYHETVTVAAVKAVHHFILISDRNTFREFIAANGKLLTEFKQLLSSHYSHDIFGSSKARARFIEPDLEPFD